MDGITEDATGLRGATAADEAFSRDLYAGVRWQELATTAPTWWGWGAVENGQAWR